jgi:hypothetical protein
VVARQHTLLCESIVALQARSHTVECLTRFAQTTSNNIGNSWPHDVSRATTPQQHNSKATRKRHKGGGRGREELYATGTTRGGGNNNDERATTTTTRRSNSVGKVFQLLADITIHTMSLLLASHLSRTHTVQHTQYNTHSTMSDNYYNAVHDHMALLDIIDDPVDNTWRKSTLGQMRMSSTHSCSRSLD